MEVQFREMKEEDIQQVVTLFKKLESESAEVSFAEILDEAELCEKMKETGCFFYVAEDNGQVVSVFRGKQGEGNKSHSALLTIAVDPNFRGKKMAKTFTQYCLDQLKNNGITLARAYVYSNNKPSINTLLSQGFTFSGCVYQHHKNETTGEFVDDIIFHKIL
ncbi:GNAT family N-acetyltransferase [Alkaliphilus transvaalensis]|uniref:GNAT family N-acetyltransferase n=1 Tax=Alkaliphilus transvaalensis TaxID=114628 RepID=UPI00047C8D79|nr:GNAT family N-acetyltransferase [Alkaliphilus transvaalensis]